MLQDTSMSSNTTVSVGENKKTESQTYIWSIAYVTTESEKSLDKVPSYISHYTNYRQTN
jgi:hypothetical protein